MVFMLPQAPSPSSCHDKANDEAAELMKLWNLRPQKLAFCKAALEIGTGHSRNHNHNDENSRTRLHTTTRTLELKSLRLRGFVNTEVIEEDIFIITGSRPAHKPKKQPKNVQKQMDSVFLSLWLMGITVDAYRSLIHLRRGEANLEIGGTEARDFVKRKKKMLNWNDEEEKGQNWTKNFIKTHMLDT
ncbi:DUF1639 family protein [Spatholobus suberectus]|nr:DUF1639 family protein [Spatholobus suberectus]